MRLAFPSVAVGLATIILFVTNPSQDEYLLWLRQQDAPAGSNAGGGLAGLVAGALLNAATVRKNYGVLSVFETDPGGGAAFRSIGLLHQFFVSDPPRPPPHVFKTVEGRWATEDGYRWVDAGKEGDLRVRWVPGTASAKYAHVFTANAEGQWRPEDGYAWRDNARNSNKEVVWSPGIPSRLHPHVIADTGEGGWVPQQGYNWLHDPPGPGQFEVVSTGSN